MLRKYACVAAAALVAVLLVSGAAKAGDNQPDPCKDIPEKMQQAGNEFGHGNFGNAAEKLGQAAGALKECIGAKVGGSGGNNPGPRRDPTI